MVMERLSAAGRLSENKDPVKQFAIKNARRLLLDAGVKDPGPKIERVIVYSSEPRFEPKELLQFSTEAREGLRKEGYMIHSLTGESVATFLKAHRPIEAAGHKGREIESFSSRLSEVAINPERLFLPNSNRKTFSQQEEMVRQFSLELNGMIPQVEAVIGDVADYVGTSL